MANFVKFIKLSPKISIPTIWHDLRSKKDPHAFAPNGSQIFYGYQGEGKTLSMVHYAFKVLGRYPRAIICTNLHLSGMKPIKLTTFPQIEQFMEEIKEVSERNFYIYFETHDELIILLRYLRNDKYGVVFAIDEIHNYFHSHDSKSMPMWVVQVFSQQRKQHLLILGTVQDWEDVIKAIRRQIDNLVKCSKIFYFIHNASADPRTAENQFGETTYKVRKHGLFFISKKLRDRFDTYKVINSGREILGGQDLEQPIYIRNDIKRK